MLNFFRKSRFLHSRMAFWRSNAKSFKDAQDLCVGSWNEQEQYPYAEYLLERYSGNMGKAYDFGCGVGRMMKHMLYRFEHVDGGELGLKILPMPRSIWRVMLRLILKTSDYFNLMANLLLLGRREHMISFIPQSSFITSHHSKCANKYIKIF